MGRSLRRTLFNFNDATQPFIKMRGQSVLTVLGCHLTILFSVSVRRNGAGKAVSGMQARVLAGQLGDDVVEVWLRAEAVAFEDLPH